MTLQERWQQYKPLLMKIGITIISIPILIIIGGVLFSVLGFIFSLILGLIVFSLCLAAILALWGYTDVKFGNRFAQFRMKRTESMGGSTGGSTKKPKTRPSYKTDETITIDVQEVKKEKDRS